MPLSLIMRLFVVEAVPTQLHAADAACLRLLAVEAEVFMRQTRPSNFLTRVSPFAAVNFMDLCRTIVKERRFLRPTARVGGRPRLGCSIMSCSYTACNCEVTGIVRQITHGSRSTTLSRPLVILRPTSRLGGGPHLGCSSMSCSYTARNFRAGRTVPGAKISEFLAFEALFARLRGDEAVFRILASVLPFNL